MPDTSGDPVIGDAPQPVHSDPLPPPAHPVIVDDGLLSQAELDYFVDAAVARWSATGLTAEQLDALEHMTFTVGNLSGLNLGAFAPTQVMLDADAAGRGWYLDGTPLDDASSAPSSPPRGCDQPTGAPAGHSTCSPPSCTRWATRSASETPIVAGDRDELMYGWLYSGERRLPGAGDADGAVAGAITSEEFLGAPIDIGVLPAGKTVTIQWQATIDPQANQPCQPGQHRHGLGHQRGRLPRHRTPTPSPP